MRELLLTPSLIAIATRGGGGIGGGIGLLRKAPPPPLPTSSVVSKLYGQWFRLSSLIRFFISGNLGNICFFFIERTLYQFISNLETPPDFVVAHKDTVSFFVGYLLQIVSQHLLHAFLVYGLDTINTRRKYFNTLICQFYAYGVALFGSTFLNLFLIQSGIDRTTSFFATMLIVANINYHVIGFLTRRALQKVEPTVESQGLLGQKRRQDSNSSSNNAKGSSNTKPRTTKETKKTDAVRRIRRGGALGTFDLGEPSMGLSSQSVRQLVLSTKPVDVNAINNEHY